MDTVATQISQAGLMWVGGFANIIRVYCVELSIDQVTCMKVVIIIHIHIYKLVFICSHNFKALLIEYSCYYYHFL